VAVGEILGLHHVKIPVVDLARSRAWYERVFALEPNIEWLDDDGVVRGVAYRAKGGLMLALRENPPVAQGISGFDPLAILVESREDIDAWARRLDALGVRHSGVWDGTIGWLLSFHDPDGLELKFYTHERHGHDPEARPGRRRFIS
jgi:catechol 2,3-dioxygenase-like lactoylglutathione lyase family enzyme